MAHLQLQFLGGFSVTLDEKPIMAFESDKVRALLAYLALEHDQPHRREKLAALFWPEQTEQRARRNLNQALFNLRGTIDNAGEEPPFLISTRQTIQFHLNEHTWLDAAVFVQSAQSSAFCQQCSISTTICDTCMQELKNAIELYRGRFLDGLSLGGCPEFDQWSLIQAEYLQRLAIDCMNRLVDIYLEQAKNERLLSIASRWADIEPYNEKAHRAIMLSLVRKGQRGAALAQYETCRRILRDDLGTEPDRQTYEFYRRLLEGNSAQGHPTVLESWQDISTHDIKCPYRGLAAFREEDAPYFWGREIFVSQLYEMLQNHPIVMVVGPSGSGKSSAVYAGLLPELRKDRNWLIAEMRPGNDPFRAVSAAFQSLNESNVQDTLFIGQPEVDAHLTDYCEWAVGLCDDPKNILLIVDQFEELFTLCSDSSVREVFLNDLLEAINWRHADGWWRCQVLLNMRADFMGQALTHRSFADSLQGSCHLMGPMTRDELVAAITKPAAIHNVGFESGLVARLLDDVGDEPGNLPLLEFALTLLWERGGSGLLGHDAYDEIGQVEGALAIYADEVYENLELEEKERASFVFLQLVKPGEGTEDTRRMALQDELGDGNWPLIRHLADKRLIVTGRDHSGINYVEVAHEALIQSWDRFQEWLNDDRAFRVWQERLRGNMRQWELSNQNEGALLRGALLADAEEWLAESGQELSNAEKFYIRDSIAYQMRRQSTRDRRRKITLTGLLVGLILALLLVLFIWQQRQEARRQASIGLASQAVSEMQGAYPERAVWLALEALENYPYTWQAERALGQIILDGRLRQILAHDDYINTAEWSIDGSKILTSASDGRVCIWDVNNGEELLKITTGEPTLASWSPDNKSILTANPKDVILKVWDVESQTERFSLDRDDISGDFNINLEQWFPWSPNSTHFMTYSMDGIVKIWDAYTGKLVKTLGDNAYTSNRTSDTPADMDKLIHEYYFENGDQGLWSPAGDKILVSSNAKNRVTMWNVESGEIVYSIPGGFVDERVIIGSWSPSGDRFVTRGFGGSKLYDSSTGELLIELDIPRVFIYRAIWSPDGTRLLTSGIDDGTARIWDASRGEQLMQIANLVISAGSDWSQKGDVIAIGGNDGLIHIWDISKGREIRKLPGTQPRINNVGFSPSGAKLLAIGDENVAHIYDLTEATLSVEFDIGSKAIISSAEWSPDGQKIAIGIGDNTSKVWSATSGEPQVVFDGHEGIIWMHSWSPSGDRFATASEDQTVIIWDAGTGDQRLIFRGHDNEVFGLEWSPDGRRIASYDISSGKVILWDSNSGEETLTFSGHEDIVIFATWSPNGERILSIGSNGEALIWDSVTAELYFDLYPEDFQLDIVAGTWSKDGEQVFIQSADGVLRIINASTGNDITQFGMPSASLSLFSISPNGERLLKGGVGGAQIWELKNGSELLNYNVPGWTDASYSPDGTKVLIGSNQGNLEIYPTWNSTQELINYAKMCCLVRELTPEERELFGLPPSEE
jgi:WD40 repeat protein/DNA-binding SARP family transcriptional activator